VEKSFVYLFIGMPLRMEGGVGGLELHSLVRVFDAFLEWLMGIG
jgi:hypothetical protein